MTVLLTTGYMMCLCRYEYLCVIYSWDELCRASMEWIHQMGVHQLPNGQWQPFYGVLVNDGSIRYAAQGTYSSVLVPVTTVVFCDVLLNVVLLQKGRTVVCSYATGYSAKYVL